MADISHIKTFNTEHFCVDLAAAEPRAWKHVRGAQAVDAKFVELCFDNRDALQYMLANGLDTHRQHLTFTPDEPLVTSVLLEYSNTIRQSHCGRAYTTVWNNVHVQTKYTGQDCHQMEKEEKEKAMEKQEREKARQTGNEYRTNNNATQHRCRQGGCCTGRPGSRRGSNHQNCGRRRRNTIEITILQSNGNVGWFRP